MVVTSALSSQNKLVRFLVIGRGAMGLLHTKYLEDSGHPVAIYSPYVLQHHDSSCYGVKTVQDKDIQLIKARSCDIEGAKNFLLKNDDIHLSGVFVAVKAHQIQSALTPFVDTLPLVSSVILLHNGLLDHPTNDFLDKLVPHSAATMISSRGSTLLTLDELPSAFARVSCEMGSGPSFVFPRATLTDDAMAVLRTMAKDAHLPSSQPVAFPQCTLITKEQGKLEQYLKLSVNVAINGLLARLALRDWYFSNGSLPVRRIKNKEVLPELPLAQSIARLTFLCAASAVNDENNYLLQKAIKNDEAARRVETTILKVMDNVCSTVADICSGQNTEREALLSMLLEELPRLQEAQKSVSVSFHEAFMAIEEISNMLTSWDKHIVSLQ